MPRFLAFTTHLCTSTELDPVLLKSEVSDISTLALTVSLTQTLSGWKNRTSLSLLRGSAIQVIGPTAFY